MSCLNATEEAMLEILNAYRVDQGLQPVVASAKLTVAAYKHTSDMLARQYVNTVTQGPLPEGQSGPTVQDRVSDAGYTGWTTVSENVAGGNQVYANAQAVFDAWLSVPQYLQNINDPNVTQVGIGMGNRALGTYRYVWTVDFSNGNDSPPGC
jgi:uncharacterized protein YkwD